MNLLVPALSILLAIVLCLVAITRISAWMIARRNPPVGDFADIDDARIHYVHVPAGKAADLPPLVFIHGASANLKDQMLPLRPLLEGRAELLFLDRPGHGWSTRGGAGQDTQAGQAATIAALMERLGIRDAIIVAHSFGGSIAAAFALDHPQRTRGLLFLAAATHPWPGGRTSWYYHLVTTPVIGRLFSETLTLPAGLMRMADATLGVFAPNPVPDGYVARTSIPLVLRPQTFRANAVDVQSLYDYARRTAPRYGEITAPTLVISGNRDTVVYEEIHSVGLARDIEGAELVWVDNLGHKPDWIAADLVVDAIRKLAGHDVDLLAAAQRVEARTTSDRSGVGRHYDPSEPTANVVAQ
ncbi:alpha/beta hydrolase [Escherichia coli]|nr:alpha/beta hydrolase [Escherichia coli]